jgi:long-subunit acyl-CoA synthetase (AMP-forming)
MPAMPISRTIPALLDEMALRFPQREALVGGGGRLTYAALRAEVRKFAKGLHALGIRKSDMVAILMGNKPEWIIADLAICSLGAVMVAVNTWVTSRELGYVLVHSDTRAREWREREVDYDGPDADGCKMVAMIHEDDFRQWLNNIISDALSPKKDRRSRQQDLVREAINAACLDWKHLSNPQIEKQVGDWLKAQGRPAVKRDTILRATGRRRG